MSKKYFEYLDIRDKKQVTIGDYTAYYYKDNFMGEWYHNVNVYKKDEALLHATLIKELSIRELREYLEKVIRRNENKIK